MPGMWCGGFTACSMGSGWSRGLRAMTKRNERRVLLLGLDGAGKTTLLYRMTKGETVQTEPTVSVNVDTTNFLHYTLHVWDVGGQEALRPHWSHHLAGTQGLIFVVDSTDRERFPAAAAELASVLESPDLQGVPCLVVANKSDAGTAAAAEEVQVELGLPALFGERTWAVQGMSAATGEGLEDGLTFLTEHMQAL